MLYCLGGGGGGAPDERWASWAGCTSGNSPWTNRSKLYCQTFYSDTEARIPRVPDFARGILTNEWRFCLFVISQTVYWILVLGLAFSLPEIENASGRLGVMLEDDVGVGATLCSVSDKQSQTRLEEAFHMKHEAVVGRFTTKQHCRTAARLTFFALVLQYGLGSPANTYVVLSPILVYLPAALQSLHSLVISMVFNSAGRAISRVSYRGSVSP